MLRSSQIDQKGQGLVSKLSSEETAFRVIQIQISHRGFSAARDSLRSAKRFWTRSSSLKIKKQAIGVGTC